MGPPGDAFGLGTDRASLSPERDRFQEHSSVAGSLRGPRGPLSPSTAPAPSPPRASVFASSRNVPVCRRAEEVV